MTEAIPLSRRDRHRPRHDGIEERLAARARRTVVRRDEEVDREEGGANAEQLQQDQQEVDQDSDL